MLWNVTTLASLSSVVGPRALTNVGLVGSSSTFLFAINSLQYAVWGNDFNPAAGFGVFFFLLLSSSFLYSLAEYIGRPSLLSSIVPGEVLYCLLLMDINEILFDGATE